MNIKKILEEHNLTEEEYKKIKKDLNREPNINEIGVFSVMWSEHCSYKSSKTHLKKLPTESPRVIQGPGENAGIVDIDDGYAAVFKIESHNHPSFIEPFQGAATGVGGILRDVFTMGARPVAVMDSLRFGELDKPLNRNIFKGVVSGISSYGNSVGVPTVGGETFFDNGFNFNPLVNVFCLGLTKKDKIFYARAKHIGAKVFYAGAKTGRDGIHGATMASAEFDESSEGKRPNVQVGDPFKEKLLIEACLEAMEKSLISSIQDMGAAGLTSSSVEMAGRGGTGIKIDISKVPKREEGMNPYEILLSESQERMLIVAPPGKEKKLRDVFKKWDLDIVEIGEIKSNKRFTVSIGKEIVVDIPVKSLTSEAPEYKRPYKKINREKEINTNNYLVDKPLNLIIEDMLKNPNTASKEWVYEQYDHMIQTNTVIFPGNGAAVIRVKGTNKFLSLTVDGNPDYVYLNPKEGTRRIVSEAYLNIVSTGAKPIGATNCLNFGNPEKKNIMGEFKFSVEGMGEACTALNIPITGGNVSFYNETEGKPIKPTPVFGLIGLIEGKENLITPGLKDTDDLIYIVGNQEFKLDGSFYLKKYFKKVTGKLDKTDLNKCKKIGDFILDNNKIIKSASDISDGGLFITLIEEAESGNKGFELLLEKNIREDIFLFGEAPSSILITTSNKNKANFEEILSNIKLNYKMVGKVKNKSIKIIKNKKIIYNKQIMDIKNQRKNLIKNIEE